VQPYKYTYSKGAVAENGVDDADADENEKLVQGGYRDY